MEKQSFSDGLFSPLGIKRVIFMLVLLTTSFISCSNSDEKGGSLEVAQEYRNLEFDARGSRQTIQIDGPAEWHISTSESWCKSSHTIGEGKQYVNITVEANDTQKERTATVTVSASGAPDIIINVKQSLYSVPAYDEYIAPDNTGMRDLTSMQLSALMKAGVNVGNTFEAVIVGNDGSLSGDETCWGNPTPNKVLFEGIKAAGFDVVRIPVAYSHQFEDAATYKIKSAWMDKVEAAVKAALDAGLYVIINIHWEGGWLNHPVDANKEALDERLEAMWKQIALRFRDSLEDGNKWLEISDIYAMPDEREDFTSFVNGLYATGGGDTPESGLEALHKAFSRPNWGIDDGYHRQVVILWTDAPYLTTWSLEALEAQWNEMPSGRRLVLFAPNGLSDSNSGSWENLDSWKNVMHITNTAEGFENIDYVIEAIIGELTGKEKAMLKKATLSRITTFNPNK